MRINSLLYLSTSLVLVVSPVSIADEVTLDKVQVSASGQLLDDVAQPVRVFNQEDMQQHNGDTLGELLSNLPGISNASFGAGVGRPVIRGLSGNRVKMAVNGTDSADVSAMSSDHASMVNAANAEQVEVIYGPNTLRFGSGAMGGVINMADSRFHEMPMQGTQARVQSSVSSANAATNVNASLDSGFGQWVMHVDGFTRTSENFTDGNGNEVYNTATDSQGMNVGVNYIQSNGHAHGVAVSLLNYEYGVPNPDNEGASLDPNQLRLDGQSILYSPFEGIEQIKSQLTHIDYEHGENHDGSIVGLFDKTSTELKSTLSLFDLGGWRTDLGVQLSFQDLAVCHDDGGDCSSIPDYSDLTWDGTQGANLSNTQVNGDFLAHDNPMPLTQTQDLGVFWVMERDWANGLLEFGVRFDQRTITADPVSIRPSYRQQASYYDDKTFDSATISAAMTWRFDAQKVGVSVSRSQRAPSAEELYWNGDHHATFSFQLDNPDLDVETAYSLDVTWTYEQADYQIQSAVYYYEFDGYIYNDLISTSGGFHGNPVYRNEQKDAWLSGAEWQLDYNLNSQWQWFVRGDVVKAQLKQGENKNLPRTPPLTASTGVKWMFNQWQVNSEVKHYAKQSDVAVNESVTDAYSVVNVYGSYSQTLGASTLEFYVKAHNLTDELGRNHVSYLKEFSPVMGRNLTLGATYQF